MGWTNYIIIPKLKLIVETNRSINEISDYQKKSLNYLINEDRYEEDQDIENKNIKNISIKDLTLMFNIYEKSTDIVGLECDKFLLYWLELRNIKYKILSEFEISDKLEEYEKTHTILRIFEDDE